MEDTQVVGPVVRTGRRASTLPTTLALFLTVVLLVAITVFVVGTVSAQGTLTVEIIAGYNLVVDSNASSPSTFAPSAATVIGRFCNTGDQPLTNVQGYIGDYSGGTPGIYPTRNSAGFAVDHPLRNTGVYSFTHIGGQIGTGDATRDMGTLPAGECRVQYWHFTYPQCSEPDRTPPCSGIPVWGDSVKPEDDLWLTFDIWGTADGGSVEASRTWTMTMRNEISAMANKIEPNPDGRWFNVKPGDVAPGDIITSNGIHYELGNVRFGFDNDGDYVPDYNAWLQPVGNAGYDPSCFRLIRTTGVLTVARGSGYADLIITFDDRNDPPSDPGTYGGPLYFTNLPDDNTGVEGNVYYTFLALVGPCATSLSPYQEVASGYDNEKFNGDYGPGGPPPLTSTEPDVTIDKSSDPDFIPLGGVTTYTIPFANGGTESAGLTLSSGGVNMPLVLSDTIPAGMQYVAGSATYSLSDSGSVTIWYSIDSGGTWTTTEPVSASAVTTIQWRLDQPLPAGSTGNYARFRAMVPVTYTGSPFIENCVEASFGDGTPFDEACDPVIIQGPNTIGDWVWRDDDNDGLQDVGEPGIANVTVSLYWDKDGGGTLDDGDLLIVTQVTTDGTGIEAAGWYSFTLLPDGNYLVKVDKTDGDIPDGHRITTLEVHAVNLDAGSETLEPVHYEDADFGFGPVLSLDKLLISGDPSYEGDPVIYTISLTNERPGDGSGEPQPCSDTTWAGSVETTIKAGGSGYSGEGNKGWTNPGNASGIPDTLYTTAPFANAIEYIGVNTWNLGTFPGKPNSVEILAPMQVSTTGWVGTETFEVRLIDCGGDTCTGSQDGDPAGNDTLIGARTYNVAADLSSGTFVVDVTSWRDWTWADFNGSNIVVQFRSVKSGGTAGTVDMDSVAFRVANGLTCNDPDDVISPLPMTDNYDADLLTFVSADPTQSSASTTGTPPTTVGTITWNDLGPLYPGQTKVVTVTFTALEPPAGPDGESDPISHTNCASVTEATFFDGQPTNDVQDCETHTINPTGSIGDTVWNDNGYEGGTAGNGVQEGGEYGIPNVTVYLCTAAPCNSDNAIATDVTDADGKYLFEGLRDNTYTVTVDTSTLPGTTFTQTGDPDGTFDNQGSTTINNSDGDPDNDDDLDQDFGYLVPNTIYGNVWEDNDGDGNWESGENGIDSVTVELWRFVGSTWVFSGTVDTDSAGGYIFSDLPDGDYQVRVISTTLPADATWTQTGDPDSSLDDQHTLPVTVSGGNIYGPYDFGYHRSGDLSLGDRLYVDWNGDGNPDDDSEPGISGVTISLYQDDNGDGVIDPATDGFIMTTTTNTSGVYSFTNLAAQSYIVVVDESALPANYVQTADPDEGGTCTTCDGKGKRALAADDWTVDFGYQPRGSGSIGDFVWRDDDGDGIQDPGEPGIADISVSLYVWNDDGDGVVEAGEQGSFIATRETGADGSYLFSGLPAGKFLVDVNTGDPDLPKDGYGQNYVLSTNNDPQGVTLATAEDYREADFGFTTGGAIGDFVWQDNNGDGNQDPGEPGIGSVRVWLYGWTDVDGDGIYSSTVDTLSASPLMTTATNASGYYSFTSLAANDYVVKVDTDTLPSGFAQTGDPDWTSTCSGNQCDSASGSKLGAGEVDMSRDFGYQPLVNLGDFVWMDLNQNGVPDDGEPGIHGVVITLTLQGGGVLTTTTNNGWYSFVNVPDGTHTVEVDTDTLPPNLTPTYDLDGGNDHQASVTVSGSDRWDVDFGYTYQAGAYSISGTIFWDAANNGQLYAHPPDEPYESIQVYLWNSDGDLVGITTTNSSGFYIFPNLRDGETYTVAMDRTAPELTGTTMTYEPDISEPGDTGYCGTSSTTCNNRTTVTIPGADVTDQDWGFYSTNPPTAVTLASFTATGGVGRILLSWETVSEVDNLGFRLYRAESAIGKSILLNEDLIFTQAPGSPEGAVYTFVDQAVVPGTTYYYWLEDVDIRGATTRHGPVSALSRPAAPYHYYLPVVGR